MVSYVVTNASWLSPHNSTVEVVIGTVVDAYPLQKYIHISYRSSRCHVIVSCTPSRSHHFETEVRDTYFLAGFLICAVISPQSSHKSPFKTYRNHTIRHPICRYRQISSCSRYLAHSTRPVRDQHRDSCNYHEKTNIGFELHELESTTINLYDLDLLILVRVRLWRLTLDASRVFAFAILASPYEVGLALAARQLVVFLINQPSGDG